MARSGYYKVHLRGKFGQTLCGKSVTFDAGMCGKRWHEITDKPNEVTCPQCRGAAPNSGTNVPTEGTDGRVSRSD